MQVKSWEQFHFANSSEPGPNGLLRVMREPGFVAPGEGTWDYINKDFE